jgi:hypothetical protein
MSYTTVVSKWTNTSHVTQTGWALISSIIANVISEYCEVKKKGLLILDPHESGSEVLSKLGEQIGLQAFRCTAATIQNLSSAERKHDLPLILLSDGVTPEWQEWLLFSGPRNVVLSTGLETIHNLAMLESWNIIKVPELNSEGVAQSSPVRDSNTSISETLD